MRAGPTEQAHPGLLTIIIGVFIALAGVDADNLWVVAVGAAVVAAGAWTTARRG